MVKILGQSLLLESNYKKINTGTNNVYNGNSRYARLLRVHGDVGVHVKNETNNSDIDLYSSNFWT